MFELARVVHAGSEDAHHRHACRTGSEGGLAARAQGEQKRTVETLNRIERAKVTPDTATIAKFDRALRTGKPTRRRPVLRRADAR